MTGTFRLRDLSVANLDYVFNPPGLPLVAKGEENGGTTSILVRGAAGTGKTTLGLALAHSIARHHGGLTLCLTTEFSPAEVMFKAEVLGLGMDQVSAWPPPANMRPGSFVVQALSALEVGAIETSASRKLAAFDGLYGLLHPDNGQAPSNIRAVVLDALTLPTAGEQEGVLRQRLLEMIQGLEHDGISTVLIEEAAPGASEWAAFIVDVVLDLSLAADPETGELHRKLGCRKSRYAFSTPGPHNYGLDEDSKPAVWPSLSRIVGQSEELRVKSLPIYFPAARAEQSVRLTSGGVVLAFLDSGMRDLHRMIGAVSGVISLDVRCAANSELRSAESRVHVPESSGPSGLSWVIFQLAKYSGANVCFIHRIEVFLSRPAWRMNLIFALQSLSRTGLIVVVVGKKEDLSLLTPVADYASHGFVPTTPFGYSSHLRAERWLASEQVFHDRLVGFPGLLSTLWSQTDAAATNYVSAADMIEQDLGELLTGILPGFAFAGSVSERRISRVALSMLAGSAGAGRNALDGTGELEHAQEQRQVIWCCVQAVVAGNASAVDALGKRFDAGEEPWIFGSLCHGLARTERLEEADRRIHAVVERYGLPDWFRERFQAEIRLALPELDAKKEARSRFEQVLQNPAVARLQRAEIECNLAVALTQLGRASEARTHYQTALDLSPGLKEAKTGLATLAPANDS